MYVHWWFEEHKNNNVNLFKKVLITTKRAKSLYSLEESARSILKHKPTFQAIMENNLGQVIMKSSIPSIDENDDGPE